MITRFTRFINHFYTNIRSSNLAQSRRAVSTSVDNTSQQARDELTLRQEVGLKALQFDDVDELMSSDDVLVYKSYFPNTSIQKLPKVHSYLDQRNVVVVQPWLTYSDAAMQSDPQIQLQECVSLGNTIHNWQVVANKIFYSRSLNRKHLVHPKAFEELKQIILSQPGTNTVFFGVELLGGVQLSTLERELMMPVYDRFTVVLNIFRQHARTKEAKIQTALAELPYIKSHLREIHESSDYSSASRSLKLLVGGAGEKYFKNRMDILKKREVKLRRMLELMRKQRDTIKRQRKREENPTIAVVGYTNSGKSSLIKYLTGDQDITPADQLFATLDVSGHRGDLPSCKSVLYLDTVGFISRIPHLLIEAFSETLRDVQESDLIIHLLDVTHPDHRLQYSTVMNALNNLKLSAHLMNSMVTVGNKIDLRDQVDTKEEKNVENNDSVVMGKIEPTESRKKCDIEVSVTKGLNMVELSQLLDTKLGDNIQRESVTVRIANGGEQYSWLNRNATILKCTPDEIDSNYLVCKVNMSPAVFGRWNKHYANPPRS